MIFHYYLTFTHTAIQFFNIILLVYFISIMYTNIIHQYIICESEQLFERKLIEDYVVFYAVSAIAKFRPYTGGDY